MRDLIVTENITLDGVIDLAEGWFAPAVDAADADQGADQMAVQREHMAAADAVLLGRVTYQEFEGFWPRQIDDPTGISAYLDRTTKYVVSRTLTDPAWRNTTVLDGPLEAEITRLKASAGGDVVATGSVRLVQALTQAGLVEEFRLWVYPVVLGRGRRLFADATGMPGLHLVEARPFPSGTVLMRYRTAGPNR